MKICVVTATYPMEGFGGVFIKEQCEQLAANGHEVRVLYCSSSQSSIHDLKTHSLEENGVRVYYSCFPHYATTYAPRFWCWVMLIQLRKLYRRLADEQWRPDVFYAHFSFPSGKIAIQLGKEEKIPVVIAEHWSGLINGKARGGVLSIIQHSISNAASVICVSPALKDAVGNIINRPDGIQVIPNMLSSDFRYLPRKKKDQFVFFSLGTLNEKKQFDLLIKSFAAAFGPDENVQLRIGGSGPDENKLRQLIKDFDREHQIALLGRLNREESIQEYALCDSFVLLSPKETFGIVYREAMAIGRPVISLDNGGINYAWRDENGIIIRCSPEDIYEQTIYALRKMVSTIDDYDLKHISDSTLEEFSANEVSVRIENVLREAVIGGDQDMERE